MGCTSSNTNKKRESLHYPTRDSTFEETNQLNQDKPSQLRTDLSNKNHNDDEVIGDMRPSVSKKEMRKEQEKLRDAEIR